MLRPIGWAQLYYGSNGGPSGARNDLDTYAIYSFSTLKLIRVFMYRAEAEKFVSDNKLTKVICVRYTWENSDETRGHKRLEHTPDKVERCKFSDTRRFCHWNKQVGKVS